TSMPLPSPPNSSVAMILSPPSSSPDFSSNTSLSGGGSIINGDNCPETVVELTPSQLTVRLIDSGFVLASPLNILKACLRAQNAGFHGSFDRVIVSAFPRRALQLVDVQVRKPID